MRFSHILLHSVFMFFAASHVFANDTDAPRIATSPGEIQGVRTEEAVAFLGVPYAAPPIGEMRWKPAAPIKPWEGVLKADAYGPLCPQVLREEIVGFMVGIGEASIDEDCLTLNVHAPQAEDGADKRPVLVYIHGGGFVSGGSAMGDPNVWTREGFVYVSFNYRLGALGFFSHPSLDPEIGTNFALTDMLAALKWVRNYIEQVGGDPENVTIMGLSAGAQAAQLLMTMPEAEGLFVRAISQSGYGAWPIQPRSKNVEARDGQPSAELMGDELSRLAAGSSKTLSADELYEIPAARFAEVLVGFQLPIIDGVTLRDEAGILFAQGDQHKVAYMSGATSYEGNMFVMSGVTEEVLRSYLGSHWPEVEALYAQEFSINRDYALSQIFGDMRYVFSAWWSTQKVADLGLPAYLYMFDYVPDELKETVPGAPHGYDGGMIYFDAGDEVGDLVRQYWVNFIKNGNPNSESLPDWPVASSPAPSWMVLSDEFQVSKKTRDKKMKLFNRLYLERVSQVSKKPSELVSGKN